MDIDPALRALMRSGSEEPVNVIIGVRVGAKELQAKLDAAGFATTGSSDFGGEVMLHGRINARNLEKLAAIKDIGFISADTEQHTF
jgi:hypothetical protein